MTAKQFNALSEDAPERKTHAQCARCGEVRPLEEFKMVTIMRHAKQRHLEKQQLFWIDKSCAAHEQMGMEG